MKSILLQLDSDPQPSVFDAVVAVDSGVDQLFRHGGVTPSAVRDLVHGLLFTRGPADLKNSAVFVGGSDVSAGDALLKAVTESFFGPFRVSVLMDANGANTTASAAVLAAIESMGGSVQDVPAAVLGATGPVGQRVARLLSREGARVRVASRRLDRAEAAARSVEAVTGQLPVPFSTADNDELADGLEGAQIVISAGAAGAVLLPGSVLSNLSDLRVAIDLNAVPPLGIEGVEAADKGTERDGVKVWGALGVGGRKMKIHRKAVQSLFESNDRILDAEEVLALGRTLS